MLTKLRMDLYQILWNACHNFTNSIHFKINPVVPLYVYAISKGEFKQPSSHKTIWDIHVWSTTWWYQYLWLGVKSRKVFPLESNTMQASSREMHQLRFFHFTDFKYLIGNYCEYMQWISAVIKEDTKTHITTDECGAWELEGPSW